MNLSISVKFMEIKYLEKTNYMVSGMGPFKIVANYFKQLWNNSK